MLSIQSLKSAAGASAYYGETYKYYKDDPVQLEQAISWQGKAAERLGLTGFVEKEQFLDLLSGKLPHGQQLGRIQEGDVKHRPGFDMTFNAPKSVSVLAFLGGDKRLIAAHDEAVEKTLSLVESLIAETRIYRDGEIHFEKTANLAIAKFRQATSRLNDPHLHTHSVILNLTQALDGIWRSLASDMSRNRGTVEEAWTYRNYFGMVYRAYLAENIQKLGYEIEKTHLDGRFEIAGVPKHVLEAFSQRREEIEKLLLERGWEGAKAAQAATLLTRPDKIDDPELEKKWQDKLTELGFNAKAFVQNTRPKQSLVDRFKDKFRDPEKVKQEIAEKSVRYAANHLAEREAVFSDNDLMLVALAYEPGKVVPERLKTALDNAVADKSLISITGSASSGAKTYWTTPWAIAIETKTVGMIKEGEGQVKPVATQKIVKEHLANTSKTSSIKYTDGQRQAIQSTLNTKNRIMGVQGYAGVGKTTMLKAVKTIAEEQGFSVRGTAPSAAATQQLGREAGIDSKTLQRVIRELSNTKGSDYHNTLFLLDEASMVSTKQMHDFVKLVTQHNSRVILLGDSSQLPSVEAGKPFSLAQAFGMETVVMKDILRQQNMDLRQGVYDLIDGRVKDAFDKIKDVNEIDNKHHRLAAIAEDYLKRSTEERAHTLVLIPKHEDRYTVNQLIRDGLQKEKTLQGTTLAHQAIVNKSLTYTEQLRARNYFPGDIVRFNRSYKTLGVKTGEYLTVIQTEQKRLKKNVINLQNTDGKTIHWNPGKVAKHKGSVEVYQARNIELQAGDEIIWRRNFTDNGIINGQTAHVTAIKDNQVHIELQDGKQLNLNKDASALKHLDYSYTMTDYSAQGKSYQHVIAHSESHQKFLTTQQAFYVQVSRAVNTMTLYTDNKEQLIRQLERTPGGKTSAVMEMKSGEVNRIERGDIQKSASGSSDKSVTRDVSNEREL